MTVICHQKCKLKHQLRMAIRCPARPFALGGELQTCFAGILTQAQVSTFITMVLPPATERRIVSVLPYNGHGFALLMPGILEGGMVSWLRSGTASADQVLSDVAAYLVGGLKQWLAVVISRRGLQKGSEALQTCQSRAQLPGLHQQWEIPATLQPIHSVTASKLLQRLQESDIASEGQ